MTATESPAVLLRRAADRLDELDEAALDDWTSDGRQICVSHGATQRLVIGNFGLEEDAGIAAAMRPVAAPLAAWLRVAADVLHWNIGFVEPPAWTSEAIDLARAVLGETGTEG